MHTVELLERLVALAQDLGYHVRHEWLGGQGGGRCEYAGKRWIFVDLALTSVEQAEQLANVLRLDPAVHLVEMPTPLRRLLDIRRSA